MRIESEIKYGLEIDFDKLYEDMENTHWSFKSSFKVSDHISRKCHESDLIVHLSISILPLSDCYFYSITSVLVCLIRSSRICIITTMVVDWVVYQIH